MTQSDVNIYTIVQDGVNCFNLYCQSYTPDLSFRTRTKKQYIIGLSLTLHVVKLLLKSIARIQDTVMFHHSNSEKLYSYQEFLKTDLYIYFNPDYDPDTPVAIG